jgi:hypothetical protein
MNRLEFKAEDFTSVRINGDFEDGPLLDTESLQICYCAQRVFDKWYAEFLMEQMERPISKFDWYNE